MTISADQLVTAQSFVGLKYDQDDIGVRYLKFFDATSSDADLSLYYTVVEIMREQLAVMTQDNASAISAEGMSISWVTNLTTLRQRLNELETVGILDIGRTVGVGKLVRLDPR